jgi:hypothetical protein
MKKLFLLTGCALALAACTFPQTKMEPVGAAQTQQSQSGGDGAGATSAPASAQSAAATR